ncbi:TNT domain-containing protein [Actinomadura sp. NPDC048394]|uniref:TNT domain-containing protein n=1 Tax=Actinomadura sp. NPDC048394 TaxID=3158223 RepID=UPI0033C18C54
MARDYDAQLLESVVVRRRRLRDALMFGSQRNRREFGESTMKAAVGLWVAAVLCAGLVGVSFLRSTLNEQKRQQEQQSQSAPLTGGTEVPASWVGAKVTFAMLRTALDEAKVPRGLYVLPGQPRPRAGAVSSYYVIAKETDRFSGGVVEFQKGRIGGQFTTEDEASRWLYGQLVVRERPVHPLDARAERVAIRDGANLAADARNKIAQSGRASIAYPLAQGALVDAFGQESGSLLFPFGTPFAPRGLPARVHLASNYHRYRVVQPFSVTASVAAPANGGRGGGVRFTVDAGLFPQPPVLPTVRWLLQTGYLERVTGTVVPK